MTWTPLKKCRILLLADLHCGDSSAIKKVPLFAPGSKWEFTGMPRANLQKLLRYITREMKDIHHVIILGDVTLVGTKEEFTTVLHELIDFQKNYFKSGGIGNQNLLDPEFFTVIPGNHDLNWNLLGTHCLSIRLLGSIILLAIDKTRQELFRYRRIPKQSLGKMGRLLKLFDKFFGNTISSDKHRPTRFPDQFGLYKKTLAGTNINLVPINTCSSKPVTRVGANSTGIISRDQIDNLNKSASDDEFCIALSHHFPLPVPLAPDIQDTYLELHDSSDVFSTFYNNGRFSLFLCGHKHKDFIWTNSTAVPNVDKSLPVITIGNTTFGVASDEHRCCVLEIEDRDLKNCSPETTTFRINYFRLTKHTCESVVSEELIPQPKLFRNFMRTTREIVKNGITKHGKIIKFINFSDPGIEEHLDGSELPKNINLEFSRWGTRLYGNSQGDVVELTVSINEYHNDPILIRFSCRASEFSKGRSELKLDSDQTSYVKEFEIVEKSEHIQDLSFSEIHSNAKIRLLFRLTGEIDIVFHYFGVYLRT